MEERRRSREGKYGHSESGIKKELEDGKGG
jgi:hypothetical protein